MINTLLKRRMENTKKNKKGFTLVELIVVLVIIAILAAVLIPTVSGYIGKAKKTAAESALKNVVTAAQTTGTDLIASHDSITSAGNGSYNKAFQDMMDENSGGTNTTDGVGIIVLDDSTGTVVYANYSDGNYWAVYNNGSYTTGKGVKRNELNTNDKTKKPGTGVTGVDVYTSSTGTHLTASQN